MSDEDKFISEDISDVSDFSDSSDEEVDMVTPEVVGVATPVEPVPDKVVEEPRAPVKTKAKRAPSKYNLFLKKKMATKKVKAMPHKERMKYIGGLWAKQKARDAKKK